MNFLVFPSRPAASAVGAISRVRLPTAGRLNMMAHKLLLGKGLPCTPVLNVGGRPGIALARYRAQHRTQCRASCMSKANS